MAFGNRGIWEDERDIEHGSITRRRDVRQGLCYSESFSACMLARREAEGPKDATQPPKVAQQLLRLRSRHILGEDAGSSWTNPVVVQIIDSRRQERHLVPSTSQVLP